MQRVVHLKQLIYVGFSCFIAATASAKESSIAVSFSGVLVDSATCYIENSQPIEVRFGSQVVVENIDGNQYLQSIPFRLSCSQLNSNSMRLKIQGRTRSVDGRSVLDAGKNGLGIALYHNRANMTPNSWYSFTYPNTPSLTAAPIKNSNANLTLGSFSMTATLTIEYQ